MYTFVGISFYLGSLVKILVRLVVFAFGRKGVLYVNINFNDFRSCILGYFRVEFLFGG